MHQYNFQELQQLLKIEYLNQFIEVVYGKQAPKPVNDEQSPNSEHSSDDDQRHFEQTDLF